MTYLEQVESLPAEIIQDFRKTGKSQAIPAEVQLYILQVDAVLQIKETERFDNITRIARELMKRYPGLMLDVAKRRVHDAYSIFHVNDPISSEIWDEVYAEKMEDLGKLCIAKGKEEIAYKAFDKAHEYRTKIGIRIRPEDLKAPIFIVSMNIKPADLGYDSANLREIAQKDQAGHYIKLINGLSSIDQADKERLLKDAGIEDAEIIDIDE